jgi:hypothetical protein
MLLHKYSLVHNPTATSSSYFMLQPPGISETKVVAQSVHSQESQV